ncbi:hypothetical protein ACHAW5_006793 [Stephanodiscus triporus]|uniref:Uncharacterized protein n=1 Tax=Stephanodiscus triporus TaxID=2934178 RepID=A0ABD3QZD5_9STRA
MTNEMVAALKNTLVNNSSLRVLDLKGIDDVTDMGWSAFSAVLHYPKSVLKRMDLNVNDIDDKHHLCWLCGIHQHFV